MIGKILCFLFVFSMASAGLRGNIDSTASSVMLGAADGVSLVISIAGGICLWSGLSEIMTKSGLSKKVSLLFKPIIYLIFGKQGKDPEFLQAMSQNMGANFLGLGNLATPLGLQAAQRMLKIGGLMPVITIIVLNSASIQLIPTTLSAIRASLGAANPFDILPGVWVSSIISVTVGVGLARLLGQLHQKGGK